MRVAFTIDGPPEGKRRPRRQKATDAEIALAYAETRSCQKVATRFRMCAQSVHDRLVRLGLNRAVNTFTDVERNRLRLEYTERKAQGELAALAEEMGRTKQFICRQAKRLGLTDAHRPAPWASGPEAGAKISAKWACIGHPRGMTGKSQSGEARHRISVAQRRIWSARTEEQKDDLIMRQVQGRMTAGSSTPPTNRDGASWKAGWREIGGKRNYYRSMWEANYARYLEWLREHGKIADWEHEPKTFWFEQIRRGVRSYKPDFRVVEANGTVLWHEVKGWMDTRSRTTIRRFAKYYPGETLIVIDATAYAALKSQAQRFVPGWEHKTVVEQADATAPGRRIRRDRAVS